MGQTFTKIWHRLVGAPRETKILMLGLEGAGKTTLLYKLKLGQVNTIIPTIGFTIEQAERRTPQRHVSFTVWDVGTAEMSRLRMMPWCRYYRGVQAVIFGVDSNRPTAITASEVAEKLGLQNIQQQWFIQPTGDGAAGDHGLYEGLDWLSNSLSSHAAGATESKC
eukprot:Skav225430  [mRNA]  locus=scaffold680:382929:386627:- [translate_table: standard]